DVGAVEPDLALVRGHLARELVDQGGLAGPVRADDGVQLAGGDVERHLVGHQDAAEALDESFGAQDAHACSFEVSNGAFIGAGSGASGAGRRVPNFASRPAMPGVRSKAIRKMASPNTACQDSVIDLSTSSAPRNTSAP